nr:PaaI family thioesterase [Desulfobotulus pelophilus]
MENHDIILKRLAEAGGELGDHFVTPPCFITSGGIFTQYQEGCFLACRFSHDKSLINPGGSLQGGFLMAAFDNVFGPFSILESGRAAVTLDLNGTFLRPLMESDRFYSVRAMMIERSARFLVMEGEARDACGRLAARAYSRMFFL